MKNVMTHTNILLVFYLFVMVVGQGGFCMGLFQVRVLRLISSFSQIDKQQLQFLSSSSIPQNISIVFKSF